MEKDSNFFYQGIMQLYINSAKSLNFGTNYIFKGALGDYTKGEMMYGQG